MLNMIASHWWEVRNGGKVGSKGLLQPEEGGGLSHCSGQGIPKLGSSNAETRIVGARDGFLGEIVVTRNHCPDAKTGGLEELEAGTVGNYLMKDFPNMDDDVALPSPLQG